MNPKSLLDQHEIAPKKSLGQNFLHDPNTLEKIVDIAELMPDDVVLEIGPGTGALTEFLAQRAKQVIAVEVDERLQPILGARFAHAPNVRFHFGDILETPLASVLPPTVQSPRGYVVVANLPYYITSAILRCLLESDLRPRRLVLTVQLEVAERLTAKPGDMSLLSVSAQYYAATKIAMRLKPAVFWPRPDVDSAVVRMDTYDTPPVDVPSETAFFRVVRAGFSQKRKQLKNALGEGLHIDAESAAALLEQANIDPRRRAETLSLSEWAALTQSAAGGITRVQRIE